MQAWTTLNALKVGCGKKREKSSVFRKFKFKENPCTPKTPCSGTVMCVSSHEMPIKSGQRLMAENPELRTRASSGNWSLNF